MAPNQHLSENGKLTAGLKVKIGETSSPLGKFPGIKFGVP